MSEMMVSGPVLWDPPLDGTSRIERYQTWLGRDGNYDELWEWSVSDLDGFWSSIWRYFELPGEPQPALEEITMPGAVWFPHARLNYAETMLRMPGRGPDEVMVVGRSQSRPDVRLTAGELRAQVAAARAGLIRADVHAGDRVAAYAPNAPETLVLMLACASIGAVFTSCPPEFGTQSVVDRWRQIEPVLLLACDGYRYAAKRIDRRDQVAEIRNQVPSIRTTVWIGYLDPGAPTPPGDQSWDDLLAEPGELAFEPLPFDAPLYILFSSGTTGLPKPIVHGHGGITLEHLKALALHHDLGPRDTFFWFTTTGWMMWNFLVSGLGVGATVVLVDGDPLEPDPAQLWRMIDELAITAFGCSAPYIMACRKLGVAPRQIASLQTLRLIATTGAPLPPAGYRWITEAVAPVPIANISGGTDVCTPFLGWAPTLPVRAGVMSARLLGCAVEAFDDEGQLVLGRVGELVITKPMPSMPLALWGDHSGQRYRETYFSRYPGVWCHGDWAVIGADGAVEVSGRSDATLNRGGVRLGTAEFYAAIEELPQIADSLVVHLASDGEDQLVLLVSVREGTDPEPLEAALRDVLRRQLSPRHVPDRIHVISRIPRTLSGKRLEIPVKRILQGEDPEAVVAIGAITSPEALQEIVGIR
ncbi:acetoacetate--CoA ligase [Nocardioides sp. NPDC127514]|uniref:acetoacetate--CoA ligase n=1 Tax=unclassified Nocardioides TaxID=2615069 RepID=UPI003316739D